MTSSSYNRLLHGSGANARTLDGSSSVKPSNVRDKALPRLPDPILDAPPTLHAGRRKPHQATQQQDPPRRQHTHSRSITDPLPRLFGKKKTVTTTDSFGTDTSVETDTGAAKPVRKSSAGTKEKDSDAVKTSKRCMCCGNKVSVPLNLPRFRCLACLTINELLSPLAQSSTNGRGQSNQALQISLEHTQTIINQCVQKHFQIRSRARHVTPDGFPPTHASSLDERSSDALDPVSRANPSSRKDATMSHAKGSSTSQVRVRTDQVRIMRPGPPIRSMSDDHGQWHSGGFDGCLAQSGGVRYQSDMTLSPHHPPPSIAGDSSWPGDLRGISSSSLPQIPQASADFANAFDMDRYVRAKHIFRPLEDYISTTFGNWACLNQSFDVPRPETRSHDGADTQILISKLENSPKADSSECLLWPEVDPKMLLLGELGENSSWWIGKLGKKPSQKSAPPKPHGRELASTTSYIDYCMLLEWYDLVHRADLQWQKRVAIAGLIDASTTPAGLDDADLAADLQADFHEAKKHAVRALLKITENVLKRPDHGLKSPEDLRFLLIILANPSLRPNVVSRPDQSVSDKSIEHSGVLKRVFGLLANSTDSCHRCLINWFARFGEAEFTRMVDLVSAFINHRITRGAKDNTHSKTGSHNDDLVPEFSGSLANASVQLRSTLSLSRSTSKRNGLDHNETEWMDDWQLKAAAKCMSLLFAANNVWQGPPSIVTLDDMEEAQDKRLDGKILRKNRHRGKQLLPTSSFYNTLLDYYDMIPDFKVWESRKDRFAFCQYPMFLSMAHKIKILEFDAKRQMEVKAREAYFDQILRQRVVDSHLLLRVRRQCLVEDSLGQISAAVGAGQDELKKGLKIQFSGEEGIDAGGLRKEWFLLLIREIFDPDHGMFVYDEDSHMCYFNAQSFETSDQYYLVGALLGLAIYNSTILDIAFPSFAFRKLLAAAPAPGASTLALHGGFPVRQQPSYSLTDLAEFRPSLAAGLQQLLDFEGDVEATFCRDFVAQVEKYGTTVTVPLVTGGENIPVTNANRHEFVSAYVRWMLDTSVTKQFEPFKRGFYNVCAGNALTLFRAEEIEMLIRGSGEALDINSLKLVASYDNWRTADSPHALIHHPDKAVSVIEWFWQAVTDADPVRQRKLLTFITGSDRIPALGATSLVLRIVAGGDGWGGDSLEHHRFPLARTCFDTLVLWHYKSRGELEAKLWRAVDESAGFGLK